MKITMMSEAAKLAMDCVHNAFLCGFEVKNQDFSLAEKIAFYGLSFDKDLEELSQKTVRRLRFLNDMKAYFDVMEDVINLVAKDDFALSEMPKGSEPKLRNNLQYLVCMADHAKNEMEARYEEAHKKAFKVAKAAS